MNVNSLLPHDAQMNQNAVSLQLEKKWEKTGLLEGLNNEVERKGMAVLLENQAKQLVTEASGTGTDTKSEEWAGVALPLVRRIFAEIAAKDFVSVQPMNLPSGLVFYLDFKYGNNQGVGDNSTNSSGGNDFLTGQGRTSQLDSVFGVTDSSKGDGTNAAVEGLYGSGRFGYSINDVTGSILGIEEDPGATTVVTAGKFVTGSVTLSDVNFNSEWLATSGSTATTVEVNVADLDNFDSEGVRAFNLVNTTGDPIAAVYPEFTKLQKRATAEDTLQFVVDTAAAGTVAADRIAVVYHKQPTDITRGDFEDSQAINSNGAVDSANLEIPEINLELRSEAIVAKTRKLKAIWSPEFAQDLNAYHSIDAEAELTSMLSEYVSQEIDLEILDMLISNAQTVERWSARIGYEYDGSGAFVESNATAQAYNQGTWFQTLGTKIQKVSNKIHQLTLRGGANFLVCSPTVATILESIPGYAADTDGDKMQFAMGVQKVGAINNRFQVYKNPYMTENTILMGYRGAQFLETGAVYSPYIPLIMTPLVYDPSNFTPRKGVMTRYAKKMVRPEFYGKVFVEGLDRL